MKNRIFLYTILAGVIGFITSAFASELGFVFKAILFAFMIIFVLTLAFKNVDNYNISISNMILEVRDNLKNFQISRDDEMYFAKKILKDEIDSIDDEMKAYKGGIYKYRHLFKSIKDGIIVCDENKNIVFINQSAKAFFGVKNIKNLSNIIAERNLLDIIHAQDDISVDFKHKDFKTYHITVSMMKDRYAGSIIYIRDISEIIKADKVRRDFVANVSHELRTPLTSIYGFSEMIESGLVTDEDTKKKHMSLIKKEAHRLNLLIEDILKLSEIESSDNISFKEKVNISSVISDVITVLEPISNSKRVKIYSNLCDLYINANPLRMKELFINLIENAIKYNKENGEVFIDMTDNQVSITDTGIGIASKDLDRVFERFYRVDKARSNGTGGTGLGLSIVKHILEEIDAKYKISSIPQKGTEIEIEFHKI